MKAVILAAGKGTRLGSLTQDFPKPMVEIGKKKVLEWILEAVYKTGLSEFVVVTGYLAGSIENYFGDGSRWGIRIEYTRQENPNGTGGAVRLTRPVIGDTPFLLTWGDILMSHQNYAQIREDFQRNPVAGTVGVNPVDDPWKGAAVYFDENHRRIQKIVEKPPKGTSTSKWNNAGLFVFDPCIYAYLDRIQPSVRGEYELPDALRLMMEEDKTLRAVPLSGFWGEVGTPEDVEQLETRLKKNELNLL